MYRYKLSITNVFVSRFTNMATPTSCIFLLTVISVFTQTSVECAVFKNVNVSLTSRWPKLFFNGHPPRARVFIESSDSLGDHVNLQPLEIAIMTHQNIPELKENSLADLPNVVEVHITSSGVERIEPGSFKNVPKLDVVNLGENLLEDVEDGVFSNLRLKILYLHHNKIDKLGPNAFNNMTYLQTVVLSFNKLTSWSSDWFLGTPVSNVYMAHNLVEELPADVFGYSFQYKRVNVPLTVLNFVFSDNGLKKIHHNAFRYVNAFGTISLANNSLKNLPENLFKWVKNVNLLDLSNNKISSVNGLFDDINIHYLTLDKNRLSCFPTDIFDVSRIDHVYVLENPFDCECVLRWEMWQQRNHVNVIYLKDFLEKCVNNI